MSNQFKDASLHISMKFISKSKLWSLWKIKCSKKATKFCEIFILLLSYVVQVKSKVKILQKFLPSQNIWALILSKSQLISWKFKYSEKASKMWKKSPNFFEATNYFLIEFGDVNATLTWLWSYCVVTILRVLLVI